MTRQERARQLRASGRAWAVGLSDAEASKVPSLYAQMEYNNKLITAGTRILWGETIKKAAVDIYDLEINNPDNAPTLWVDLPYRDGIRIIPEVITVAEAFSKDEPGWWGEEVYKSLVDNNVYTPAQYADNWELQEGI